MKDIKESLIYRDLSYEHKSIVDMGADYLQALWSENRLIPYCPEHGYKHSVRVLAIIEELLGLDDTCSNHKLLRNEVEKYLLILSVLYHDIGLQCDLSKYPSIIVDTKDIYRADFRSKFNGRYTEENIKEQLKYHHLVSAVWLYYARNHEGGLRKATLRIDDKHINCIREICSYHSKSNIYECPETHRTMGRFVKMRFLAALLRISCELDISSESVVTSTLEDFFIPDENCLYWFLHSRTEVCFDDGMISVQISLSANDYEHFRDSFNVYLNKLFQKNDNVLNVLWRGGLRLKFKSEVDCVVKIIEKPDLEQKYLDLLFPTKAQIITVQVKH